VLRRVHGGGLAKVGEVYLDGGRRTSEHLAGPLAELTAAGLLGLADPDPVTEATRAVVLTEAGSSRYAELCEQQPGGYYLVEYGHPVAGGPAFPVGPCPECPPSAEQR
jgi:hypothetical protein